jgi:uncharacterized protein YgbK (DUF1537 family)
MLDIAIVADDLTGAADTGVQFCPRFKGTVLLSHANFLPGSVEGLGFPVQVLALHSNTRAKKTGPAQERLSHIARRLAPLRPAYTYKKVDSCLRGNLGAEVEALMDNMGYDLSFIAPAFPEMGRTTLHDLHLVDGTPVGETEVSRDPVTPVTESRLSRVVKTHTRFKVAHVDVGFMEGAGERTGERLGIEIERQIGLGVRHLVFDATCRTHLDKIVSETLRISKKILLVGSAGLAGSLAGHFPKNPFPDDSSPGGSQEGNHLQEGSHLMVCGTTSERTGLQVSALIKAYAYEKVALSPSLLGDPARQADLVTEAGLAGVVLDKNNLIITIDGSHKDRAKAHKTRGVLSPEAVARGMGVFVSRVLERTRPATLFLTGGDTANAVLESLGAKGVRLFGEIVTGMVSGAILGGPMNGLAVVTKAGAFGGEDALVSFHKYLRDKREGVQNGN